jgi:ribonuclease E
VPAEVAVYLLNRKRQDLSEIEAKRNVSITIEGDGEMVAGENRIIINAGKSDEPNLDIN